MVAAERVCRPWSEGEPVHGPGRGGGCCGWRVGRSRRCSMSCCRGGPRAAGGPGGAEPAAGRPAAAGTNRAGLGAARPMTRPGRPAASTVRADPVDLQRGPAPVRGPGRPGSSAITATGCAGRSGDADIKPAPVPATTDHRSPGNHEDRDLRLEYQPQHFMVAPCLRSGPANGGGIP